jgi:transcription termination/antitermination protein NusG
MSGSPVDPSDEAVPEGTPPTPDEEPKKDADDPRERVIEAFEEAAEREAVADAAIEEALKETVAEAIEDAESVEAASDAAIQEAYEERVEEAVEAGLEGSTLQDAVAQAGADADVQEVIADAAIEEALEETVAEAVQDARSVEAMSDAAIVGELADEVEGIAAEVEAEEAAETPEAETTEAKQENETIEAETTEAEPDAVEPPDVAEAQPPSAAAAPADVQPEAEEPAETVEAGSDPFRGPGEWYVVHTYAGYENKVKTNLESRIHTMQMEDKIFDVHIPMEDVMEIKSGKKQVVQRKVFPGYLLVKMVYDNDSWYVVRNTPGVTGFVAAGTGSKPTPLSRREVEKILAVKKEEVKPTFRLGFEENDVVRIISGPFADFNGTISEINLDQSKLKVLVNIFDRETPVELSFDQVAKV